MTARLLLAACLCASVAFSKRSGKDWSKMSDKEWNAVNSEWEGGDERDELEGEGDEAWRLQEKRKKQNFEVPPTAEETNDPRAFERGQKEREAGPTMMFAKLNMTTPEGGVRTKGESDALAARWQDLLYTGGIEATAYDLEASKVLLTVQKGHQGEELKDFLVEQEEVLEVEWNSKKYRRPGVKPLPLDPAPSPRKGAKKKKKKRKRKRKRKTPGQRQQKEKAKKE